MASLEALLKHPAVCAALKEAWRESHPAASGGVIELGETESILTGA